MVQWFDNEETTGSSDDLPWAKDYVKSGVPLREYYTVNEVYVTDKGGLLITNKFKAFLFKREKSYQYLTEALEVWVKDTTLRSHLVCRLVNNGKVALGLDEENDLCYWEQEGDHYRRKSNSGDGSTSRPTPNPLLPPDMGLRGVPQATTHGDTASQTKRKSRGV